MVCGAWYCFLFSSLHNWEGWWPLFLISFRREQYSLVIPWQCTVFLWGRRQRQTDGPLWSPMCDGGVVGGGSAHLTGLVKGTWRLFVFGGALDPPPSALTLSQNISPLQPLPHHHQPPQRSLFRLINSLAQLTHLYVSDTGWCLSTHSTGLVFF